MENTHKHSHCCALQKQQGQLRTMTMLDAKGVTQQHGKSNCILNFKL